MSDKGRVIASFACDREDCPQVDRVARVMREACETFDALAERARKYKILVYQRGSCPDRKTVSNPRPPAEDDDGLSLTAQGTVRARPADAGGGAGYGLKPCPWCGVLPAYSEADVFCQAYVSCRVGDCRVIPSVEADTLSEATAIWNRRSSDSPKNAESEERALVERAGEWQAHHHGCAKVVAQNKGRNATCSCGLDDWRKEAGL